MFDKKPLFFYAGLIFCAITCGGKSYGAQNELNNCGEDLKSYIKNDQTKPRKFAKNCPVSEKLATWIYLCGGDKKIKFSDYKKFIESNPSWPRLGHIRKKAEHALYYFDHASQSQILEWFKKNPVHSVEGIIVYGKALLKAGQVADAKKQIEKFWINHDMDPKLEKLFRKEFSKHLSQQSTWQRVDRLLRESNFKRAEQYIKCLSKEHALLAQARIALIQLKEVGLQKKLNAVPKRLQNNSGLLFDRVKYLRIKDQNDKMLALLKSVGSDIQRQDHKRWWNERNILMRRFMEENNYQKAYDILKNHSLPKGSTDYVHAQWMAGWLSLRFLNKPTQALNYFTPLYPMVKTPISQSRVAYWLGETYAALKDQEKAKSWWAKAAQHAETYYGQLACAKLGKKGPITKMFKKAPAIPANERSAYEQSALAKAAIILSKLNGKDYIETFFAKLAADAKTTTQKRLLVDLVHKYGNNFLTLHHAKGLTIFNEDIYKKTYPTLSSKMVSYLKTNQKAIVHALIRQESRFQEDAVSPAGAMGMMQMMKETARLTGKKHKLPYKDFHLLHNNVRLGSAHVLDLLEKYDNYLIFVSGAYNAGSGAVTKWISYFGDPSTKKVDLVDWVELIPFGETRNYVQRVLENYMVYREIFGLPPKSLPEVMAGQA